MMDVTSSLEDVPRGRGALALAVGFFDGVHLGHQAVVRGAIERAHAAGGKAWTLTLEPHPLRVLDPPHAPPLITPLPDKLRRLEELGVEGCIVLPFTRELARQTAEQFMDRLAHHLPDLHTVVCGHNFHFGRAAEGKPSLLVDLARLRGFETLVVEPVHAGGAPVSSTRIRRAIAEGRLPEAAQLLGRPFAVRGVVSPGRGEGRRLGFPTLNLKLDRDLMPPPGVCAARVRRLAPAADGRCLPGAAYYGTRPTFGTAGGLILEVYLLEGGGDWYGVEVEVEFLEYVRPDATFHSPEALTAQIARDVADIRRITGA